MAKTIDLQKSVYELTEEYPELIEIMADLGFGEIRKKPMRHSVGKIMTIPKGSRMKGIPMGDILAALAAHGFEVENGQPAEGGPETRGSAPAAPGTEGAAGSRTDQLKGYLRRLGAGEDLESVRADFAREFEHVEASEIMEAEQQLMAEGTPLEEVQRLCDVHSALFHGRTADELLANVRAAVDAAADGPRAPIGASADGGQAGKAAALAAVPGHPLHTLSRENRAAASLFAQMREEQERGGDVQELLEQARQIAIHYAKKGDLLFPLLKVGYGISGPSEVMWTVDDEIRDELSALAGEAGRDGRWAARLQDVLARAEEMIYKEENILFPICADNFTGEEWAAIYRDSGDYAACLGVEPETWPEAEGARPAPAAGAGAGEIVMPGGHLTPDQLTALLNTIPMEITFVDAGDVNRYFNEGSKVFKRPGMAIGRDVYSCHPPKVEPMVRGIIEDFRAGVRDQVPVWMEKEGRTLLVTYNAVRDAAGTYLGTMELVQDMEFAKEHFGIGR